VPATKTARTTTDVVGDRVAVTPRAATRRGRIVPALLAAMAASALVLAGCGDDSDDDASPTSTTAPLNTAPRSARVDLVDPTFSNPTEITNPLFPTSEVTQAILVGEEAGDDLRFEVTLLSGTKTVRWKGQDVETVRSQFVGYANGRVAEIAIDYFAQADDGAVWYFGEDVRNYEDGELANRDGTWLAGKDGPAGMIMPADPQVGDVYRPENIPGFVFEEVTVEEVDKTVDGPIGPVAGAIQIQELLQDGVLEDKVFAPGYGEFHFEVPTEEEVAGVALAVPTDALPGPAPAELTTISAAANQIDDAAAAEDEAATAAAAATVTSAWDALRGGTLPPVLAAEMDAALAVLGDAIDAQDADATRQAAITVGQVALDLQLQYRPPADVDRDRLELWNRQLALDESAGDQGAVAGDEVIIQAIERRLPAA
jgi:hypothetical protein